MKMKYYILYNIYIYIIFMIYNKLKKIRIMYDIVYHVSCIMYHKKIMIHVYRIP